MALSYTFNKLSRLPQSQRRTVTLAVVTLLVLRARLLQLPREVLTGILDRASSKEKSSQDELEKALQQVYVQEKDGSKTVLVPYKQGVSKVRISNAMLSAPTDYYPLIQVNIAPTPHTQILADVKRFPTATSTHKPTLDMTFLRQLRAILRVGFRSWHSKESMILYMHSFFLVMRTILSIGVARLDGRLVRNIVSADGKGFLKGLGLWFLLAIPSAYTNTMV